MISPHRSKIKSSLSIFHGIKLGLLVGILLANSACRDSNNKALLAYIPADTVFLASSLSGFPVSQALTLIKVDSPTDSQTIATELLGDTLGNPDSPAEKMLYAFMTSVLNASDNPAIFTKTLGIGEQLQFAAYFVGTMPVVRIRLNDINAFEKLVQTSESNAGISGELVTIGANRYHRYRFQSKSNQDNDSAELIIGHNNGNAVIIIHDEIPEMNSFKLVTGEIPPQSSISSDQIQTLLNNFHLDQRFIYYFDHLQFLRGLSDGNNLFARMGQKVAQKKLRLNNKSLQDSATSPDLLDNRRNNNAEQVPYNPLNSPQCQQELDEIAAVWPRTIGGLSEMKVNGDYVDIQLKNLIQVNDAALINSLSKLRGVVPPYILSNRHQLIFAAGFGIDVDHVLPFTTEVAKRNEEKSYRCAFLKDFSNMTTAFPLISLGLVSGLAAGLHGASITLMSLKGQFSKNSREPDKITDFQLLITLSADDPQRLLASLTPYLPGTPNLYLPNDGHKIEYTLPFMPQYPFQLARKGKHVAIYIGDNAAQLANEMSPLSMQSNGLLAFYFNRNNLQPEFSKLISRIEDDAEENVIPQALQVMLQKFPFAFMESLDFTLQGIEVDLRWTNRLDK